MSRSLHLRQIKAATIALLCLAAASTAVGQRAASSKRVEPFRSTTSTVFQEVRARQDAHLHELRQKFILQSDSAESTKRRLRDLPFQLDNGRPLLATIESPSFAQQATPEREHYFALGKTGEKGLFSFGDVVISKAPASQPWTTISVTLERAIVALGFAAPQRVSVSQNTNRFGVDFWTGATNAHAYLELEALLSGPDGENAKLIFGWAETPKNRRIFVTGSKDDYPQMLALQRTFQPLGYKLFFYLLCRPLCASEAVGAFFSTSGSAIHIQSPYTSASDYVPIEVATALALDGKGERPSPLGTIRLYVYEAQILLEAKGLGTSIPTFEFRCSMSKELYEVCPRSRSKVGSSR